MTRITLDAGRDGFDGFPAGFTIVARDDAGDPLAVDGDGKVWTFAHGAGNWHDRSLAFATMQQLHAHVAFQQQLDIPDGADLAALCAHVGRRVWRWTEARVLALLQPLIGPHRLLFRTWPKPPGNG